jgi:predicted nucleic acid-binding protein
MEQINEKYFFDTYALFEILNNNPKYQKYLNVDFVISTLNLYEFYYNLIKDGHSEEEARLQLDSLMSKEIAIIEEDIINSSRLKLKNKELSVPDCFGYVIAKRLKIKFLTGDKEFKNMDNVEFVTK